MNDSMAGTGSGSASFDAQTMFGREPLKVLPIRGDDESV
jgi:hypothetical protein